MIVIAIKAAKISLTITLVPSVSSSEMSISKDENTLGRKHPYFGTIISYTFWYLRNNSEKVCLTADRTIHKCFVCLFLCGF